MTDESSRDELTHLTSDGHARMVDVGDKDVTARKATARACVRMSPGTFAKLASGDTPKGDVLATARIAGIQAAKLTSNLIPLCHQVAITKVEVSIRLAANVAIIDATAEARDRTGVEMEAMVAASTAALTLYDMLKAVDRGMSFDVSLVEKMGGKSGHWQAPSRAGRAVNARAMKADVRDTPLSIDETVASVRRPGAGGLAVFVGVVRDESAGRAVTRLEYSAYASMAKREMERIADEIEREMDGVRVAAMHRTGTLEVGDAAVVCAASAPHREEAFRACRELIDRIKSRVPVWKREIGPDGAAWIGWEDARCGPGGHDHDRHRDHDPSVSHRRRVE